MGAVYDEFVQQLDRLAQRWEGNPQEELLSLLLLALEREELVAVSYSSSDLRERLETLPIAASARELLARALVWIAEDEAMHAIWARGTLMRAARISVFASAPACSNGPAR